MYIRCASWAAVIAAGQNPQLSAYWRRRMNMLPAVGKARTSLSRRSLACLIVAVCCVFLLPTFRPTPVSAQQADKGNQNKSGPVVASRKPITHSTPEHLAKVVQQGEPSRGEIAWGETEDGLAVGIGAVRTSLKCPTMPIIDAYLENRGHSPIEMLIQSRARFILELDGKFFAERDMGGPSGRTDPGTRYGPLLVETLWFHEIPRLVPISVIEETAASPMLTEGQNTLKLYYKYPKRDVTGKLADILVPSAAVKFTVSLQPYPVDEAVATFSRQLRQPDGDLRREAALAAGNLRLSGCRAALVGALKYSDPVIRRYALESLAKIKDPADVEPVRESLQDSEIEVRLAAAACLVQLGQRLDISWLEPIIKSKKTNEFQEAVWLVHLHAGEQAVPTLIRCLDMDDPSVASYYNYTLVWQIASCGGPKLQYHHSFDGKGTAEQVEGNRRVLAQLQEYLRRPQK